MTVVNKTFVFTGDLLKDRDEYKAQVLALGGRVTTAISGKTDFLVVGENPGPSKMAKAKNYKLKILNEEELKNLLQLKETDVHENKIIQKSKELWTEKYAPKNRDDFIGNKNEINRVENFMRNDKKVLLIYGLPGIGKTTAVKLICKLNNFEFVEYNASDVRTMKSMRNLQSISLGKKLRPVRKCILMDEIDGIDRGGLPQLINFFRENKNKIICIANEKSQKLKTLENYADVISFKKIPLNLLKARVETILINEGISIDPLLLNNILVKADGDMRYCLNTLQNYQGKNINVSGKKMEKSLFENVPALFGNKSISEKIEIFFTDYDMMPLMVYENYAKLNPYIKQNRNFSKDIDNISTAFTINRAIRSEQNYSMLPYEGYFLSNFTQKIGRVDFSSFLGYNSKRQKNIRIMRELGHKMNVRKEVLQKYYFNAIKQKLQYFLKHNLPNDCREFLEAYNIDYTIFGIPQLNKFLNF